VLTPIDVAVFLADLLLAVLAVSSALLADGAASSVS
jgi:hypothetical protein